MQTYKKNPPPNMINRAILELNGIFNVNPNGQQRQNNGKPETPLQPLPGVDPAKKQYVHPRLYNQDKYTTMEQYRAYVPIYNKKVKDANLETKKYNKLVAEQREEEPLTETQQLALAGFYRMISPLDIWERNNRIAEYNRCNGKPIATKEKIQSLKFSTELVFQAIVFHYSMQLQKLQSDREKINMHFPGDIPSVKLNVGWITKPTVKEVAELPVCNKTFRRHRKRLTEAGVLQNYIFEGSARPVKMRINPKILCVTDYYQDKKTTPEAQNLAKKSQKAATGNQQVTEGGRTKCPHNTVSNRSLINNKEIKANVHKHSGERSSAKKGLTSPYFSSIGNTREQYAEKNDAAPEKKHAGAEKNHTSGQKNTLSQLLREKLEEKTDFAAQLAAHQYDDYTPIRREILEKEAYSGSLSREEFRELLFQDFFKTAAKLYKNKTPYKASWLKAYNTWMLEKFINPSGHSLNKQNIVTKMPALRYGLAAVARYLKRYPDYNLLFPGEYFDLTRTTAKEGGFRYFAREAWRKHQDYLSRKNADTKTAATKRKRRLSDLQKAEKHVKSYLKNKIALQELFDKVNQIGNKSISQDLPEIIRKQNEKQTLKFSKDEL